MPVLVSPEVENAGAVTLPAAGRSGAVMFAEPLMLCPQIVRAVPQLAVVMAAEPLKFVPLMARVVCNVVAVVALPDRAPVKVVAVTPVKPAKDAAVPPKAMLVDPIVSELLVRLALPMLLSVLFEPLMVLLVSVAVLARSAKTWAVLAT